MKSVNRSIPMTHAMQALFLSICKRQFQPSLAIMLVVKMIKMIMFMFMLMFMFMMILLHALHTSSPSVSRRVVCAALATTAAARRRMTASAADPGMISVQKIEAGLAVLDDVVARWAELTTDCNYGEIRRELLETANKEALLKAATQTSKSETMVTMCKATGRLVREAIGADKSPLSGIDKVLETPALVARVALAGDLVGIGPAAQPVHTVVLANRAAATRPPLPCPGAPDAPRPPPRRGRRPPRPRLPPP